MYTSQTRPCLEANSTRPRIRAALLWAALAALAGCDDSGSSPAPAQHAAALGVVTDKGVDLARKTIRLGVLNDETGPAAAIGKPYAAGKRLLAAQINAGGSGLLPEGWKIELVERDHGYNPQRSVSAYLEIKDDVLSIAHCLGSPNTLPLRPMLARDHMIVLPASLSSTMAKHRYTIPAGPTYAVEAMRAMDWVVAQREGNPGHAPAPALAIVYQQDDYGQDSLHGWRTAADHYRLKLASEQQITTVQRDFETVVAALKRAGATHVLLATLPSTTARVLASASRQAYRPVWLGHSPSWSDGFFDASQVPAGHLTGFLWLGGLPFWGEAVPGMAKFLDVYARFGKELGPPDYYLLVSYMQGLLAVKMIERALETGVVTRDALLALLAKIRDFDSAGLGQRLDLSQFPYVTSTRTRILEPDLTRKTWNTVADWASPGALSTLDQGSRGQTATGTGAETSARR